MIAQFSPLALSVADESIREECSYDIREGGGAAKELVLPYWKHDTFRGNLYQTIIDEEVCNGEEI